MLHRGHPFLPNKKPESGLSIRSVKLFSRTSQKVSIELANETENRLLKSGKDKQIVYSTNASARNKNSSSRKKISSSRVCTDFIIFVRTKTGGGRSDAAVADVLPPVMGFDTESCKPVAGV